jgi:hypothetical protein
MNGSDMNPAAGRKFFDGQYTMAEFNVKCTPTKNSPSPACKRKEKTLSLDKIGFIACRKIRAKETV